MNDSISRKGVSAWLYNMGYEKLSEYVLDEKRFPSVDRPQGHYIKGENWDLLQQLIDSNARGEWYCSNCKRAVCLLCPYDDKYSNERIR